MPLPSLPARFLLVAAACAALAACGSDADTPADPASGSRVTEATIDNPLISESSGLARSQHGDAVLWTHNDSGGAAAAYALRPDGHFLGTLKLTGALNLDWEDMASFTEAGQPSLLLADIGDNNAFRPVVTLYIVDEPVVDASSAAGQSWSSLPRRSLIASYPDGPRDAEAIAVDAAEGSIYIVSKRDAMPRLYRLPLAPAIPLQIAEALGPINIPRAPAAAADPDSFNWVTAMDFDDAGSRAVVVTPTHAYLYPRDRGETWVQAFARAPRSIDLPPYSQIEGVTLARDGSLYISSENLPAPLAHIIP